MLRFIASLLSSGATLFAAAILLVGCSAEPTATPIPLGELAWRYDISSDIGTFPLGTGIFPPVMSGSALFVVAADGNARALSASSGELLWTYKISSKVMNPMKALKVVDGIAFVVEEEGVHAVDAETGEPLWHESGLYHILPRRLTIPSTWQEA